jgi:lipoyl(octanoyl) transferase
VPYENFVRLQQKLVADASVGVDRRVVVLMCEHPPLITVGRNGSRAHIRLTDEQMQRDRLEVRWVARGGGCVLHAPGQLAVYPIAPLARCGWSVGTYLRRFQSGVGGALESLGVAIETRPPHFGIWGRSGLLAAMGVAVRQGVTSHGMHLNVHPSMATFSFIDSAPKGSCEGGQRAAMGCLLADRRSAARMPKVRSAIIEHLASQLQCERYHLHTGHPWLTRLEKVSQANQTRQR